MHRHEKRITGGYECFSFFFCPGWKFSLSVFLWRAFLGHVREMFSAPVRPGQHLGNQQAGLRFVTAGPYLAEILQRFKDGGAGI